MLRNKQGRLEFVKFGLVGIINTAVDFAVLNLLIYSLGLGSGNSHYSFFKIISFTAAVANSFFLNKWWVFKSNIANSQSNEMFRFLSVSIVGLVLNTSVSSIIFKIGPTVLPLSLSVWANLASLIGTLVVFVSNFFGYKFFVFKKQTQTSNINY